MAGRRRAATGRRPSPTPSAVFALIVVVGIIRPPWSRGPVAPWSRGLASSRPHRRPASPGAAIFPRGPRSAIGRLLTLRRGRGTTAPFGRRPPAAPRRRLVAGPPSDIFFGSGPTGAAAAATSATIGTMQVNETRVEGLKRELEVTVPAADLDQRLNEYLHDLKGKVRIKGFRPGKVPVTHLKRLYGKSAMAEIVQNVLQESVRSAVEERDEKPALQPDVDVDEARIESVIAGESDFSFKMSYEVLPKIELGGFDAITVDKPVAEVDPEDVERELAELAERSRSYADKEGAAGDGDKLTVSFVGKIDGEPFEGGAAEDVELVIGQGRFIPGFEEQLAGATAGEERTIAVTFPEDYQAEHLAGKEATFDVKMSAVAAPEPVELNDALAERLGLEDLGKLKEAIEGQLRQMLDEASRQKVKRRLLDALDERYDFALPEKLVESEFDVIWRQTTEELAKAGRTFEDEGTDEEKLRDEYRRIAARRVKLGLVLSEVGDSAKVEVTDEEMQRALIERVRQFPGREREVFELYRKNPQAMASLRAPVLEEKVVDYLLELVTVNETPVSREELLKPDEDETDPLAAARGEAGTESGEGGTAGEASADKTGG